jgi:hypothetical protein
MENLDNPRILGEELADAFLQKVEGSAEKFSIPERVQKNAQRGIELRKKFGRGGTSVGMNTARTLAKGGSIGIEKVRHIAKYFPRHAGDNLSDKTSNGWIAWLLWGGDAGWSWARAIVKRVDAKDSARNLEPYKLTGRQQAMYDVYERVVNDFGLFEQDAGPDGAHYSSQSPFMDEGLCCENCVYFGNNDCEIVCGPIAKEGICKLWIIPDTTVTWPDSNPMP